MPRIQRPLQPILVQYRCDECGEGNMEPTPGQNCGQPLKIEHSCTNCSTTIELDCEYPRVEYSDRDCGIDLTKWAERPFAQLTKQQEMEMSKKDKEVNLSRAINFALLTSEFQAAQQTAKQLKAVVLEAFHPLIDARVKRLEELSKQELMLAFSVHAFNTNLSTTPIYPEPMMEMMTGLYVDAAKDYYSETSGTGLRDVTLFRQKNDELYFLNAPIFRVHMFMNHPEYHDLVAKKQAIIEKEEEGSIEAIAYLNRIHETLMHVFLTPSKDFHKIKEWEWSVMDADVVDTLGLHDVVIQLEISE